MSQQESNLSKQNKKMSKILLLVLAAVLVILQAGCVKKPGTISPDISSTEWENLIKTGSNTKVSIYHDIKDEKADKWLKSVYVPSLEEKYGIKASIVKSDYADFYNKILNEKKNIINTGSIDIFLFEKSYFPQLKSKGLLYGPFAEKLNNYHKYQNPDDLEIRYCGGAANNGYAMLFGRNQMFFIFDKERMDHPPETFKEMVDYLSFTKKRMNYAEPPNKIGRDFINTTMTTGLAYTEILSLKTTKDVRKKCAKGISLLREMNKYTPTEGVRFPDMTNDVEIEFNTKVIDFSMTKTLNRASAGATTGRLPSGAKSFVFKTGTTGSAFYGIIPFNAPNKAASMLALDFLISPAMQYSKYNIHNWGNLYGIDITKLSEDTAATIKKNDLLEADMSAEQLLANRLPQIPDRVSKLLYEVWKTDVKKKK